jgi:hypothetical protein
MALPPDEELQSKMIELLYDSEFDPDVATKKSLRAQLEDTLGGACLALFCYT